MAQRKNKATETKKKIFNVTLDCLSEIGASGTTTEEIIKRAGISKGALYWHFKSKKELFLALFEFKLGSTFAEMDEILLDIVSPKQKLITIINFTQSSFAKDSKTSKAYLEFFAMAAKEEDMAEHMFDMFGEFTSFLAEIIQEGIEQGELKNVPPLQVSQLIGSMLDGLLLRQWIDKKFNLEKNLELFKQLLFTGIAVPRGDER